MKKVILAFWNRWHVMQGLTEVVGSANFITNPTFRGAQNQKKESNLTDWSCQLHLNFGQQWEAGMGPCDGRAALQISNNSWKERCVALAGQEEPIHVSAWHGHLNSGMWFPGTASPKHGTNSTRQRPHWQMCVAPSASRGHLPVHLALDFDANIVGILCYHIVWGGEEVATPSHSY